MSLSTQSGRSMIEMLGVLAIIGILSMGALAGYSQVKNRLRISEAIDEINEIADKTYQLSQWKRNYQGANIRMLCEDGELSAEKCSTNNETYTNVFGGNVTVAASANFLTYIITYEIPPGTIASRAAYNCTQLEDYGWKNMVSAECAPNGTSTRFTITFQ